MTRRHVLSALVVVWALMLAPMSAAFAQAQGSTEAHTADWVARLDTISAKLAETRANVRQLTADIGKMKRSNYPRGDARIELVERHKEQTELLAQLELELPELVERARRNGVPAGVLQRYEAD